MSCDKPRLTTRTKRLQLAVKQTLKTNELRESQVVSRGRSFLFSAHAGLGLDRSSCLPRLRASSTVAFLAACSEICLAACLAACSQLVLRLVSRLQCPGHRFSFLSRLYKKGEG